MIFYEYTINNPITNKTSVLFIPESLSFNRNLLMYSDMVRMYKSHDVTSGSILKSRDTKIWTGEHVSLLDFSTNLDVYSVIITNDYPERYTKTARQLIPMVHYCGMSFAKIDLSSISPELYATYISAFWKKQL